MLRVTFIEIDHIEYVLAILMMKIVIFIYRYSCIKLMHGCITRVSMPLNHTYFIDLDPAEYRSLNISQGKLRGRDRLIYEVMDCGYIICSLPPLACLLSSSFTITCAIVSLG
jgi:hypothetical protein